MRSKCLVLALVMAQVVWLGYSFAFADTAAHHPRSILDRKAAGDLQVYPPSTSRWLVPGSDPQKPVYVDGTTQRLTRKSDGTEFVVEVAELASPQEAYRAAELRVSKLLEKGHLKEDVLKDTAYPGLEKGDKVWGLLDPPEPGQPSDPRNRIAPISTLGVVVFATRNSAVAVSAHNTQTEVKIADVVELAKKVAAKFITKDDKDKPKTEKPADGKK